MTPLPIDPILPSAILPSAIFALQGGTIRIGAEDEREMQCGVRA